MSTVCKNTGLRQELPCINCKCESSDSSAELGFLPPYKYGEECGQLERVWTERDMHAFAAQQVAAERGRIKNGIMALAMTAENCKGDAGVDSARKALALRIATLVDGHGDLVLNEAGKRMVEDLAQEVQLDKVTSAASRAIAAMERERNEKKAALPAGTCVECEGEGEQGGQFCGGYWPCEACGGSGKSPNPKISGPSAAS